MAALLLRLFSIILVFLATSNANLAPPADTVPVQDAMGVGNDYVIVVLDFYNLTENATVNCKAAEFTQPERIKPENCALVVEPQLCLLDEKTMKVSEADGHCVRFKGVRVWRGEKPGFGAFSGHAYEKLSCLSWAVGNDFQVFSTASQKDSKLALFYPENTAVERGGIGCIAWATTELIDAESKSKIDRGYFQLSAKFSQIVGEKIAEPLTGMLPMASVGFHLAPTRLHLAFFNGSPCKANTCNHLEFRFGVFTESGASPRANAAVLKPRVKVYDER